MLLPDNIHPEHSVYYNAAFVLQALQKQSPQGLFDLYQIIKHQHNLTFPVFVLCLDWLYLIEVAQSNSSGEIELCS